MVKLELMAEADAPHVREIAQEYFDAVAGYAELTEDDSLMVKFVDQKRMKKIGKVNRLKVPKDVGVMVASDVKGYKTYIINIDALPACEVAGKLIKETLHKSLERGTFLA